ncbi:MAG TPA: RNase adapter RapZ [Alphaproteobacteria bacterium]|jgi:UPF0042 nucleotide-binding protein|nr:RNase adapter RapZ [Alphaproteobacteria bacterium]
MGPNPDSGGDRRGAGSAPPVHVVLITGLSGAGKTSALKAMEDLGYEAIDNLPLSLMRRLVAPLTETERGHALAIAVDFRTRDFSVTSFDRMCAKLRAQGNVRLKVVYLDCDNDVLARRFTETRRRHPLADDRPVMDGIIRERALIAPIAERADLVVDTSLFTGAELKRLLGGHFRLGADAGPTVSVLSFSYRKGLPREADLVFDVRFLSNPHYVDALRPLTGLDAGVADYVAADPAFAPFLDELERMLLRLLPLYQREGKSYLTIAVGCTGGRHRSVFIAERLAAALRQAGHDVQVRHRDLDPPIATQAPAAVASQG